MIDIFDVREKVIVITGAGGVLCSEIAKGLSERGALIAALDISQEKLDSLTGKIREDGGVAIGVKADVTKRESLINAKDIIMNEFGRIDVLLNGAGGNKKEATVDKECDFFSIPEEMFDSVMDLNLKGTVLSCQVFGDVFASQKKGIIINISSVSGILPLTNVVAYSVAKAAIINFTRWLAVYFNDNFAPGIRVNAIAPGFFLTEQNRFLLIDKNSGEDTARGKTIIGQTPMKRYGNPYELIGPVLWLSSDASSFVNGAVIHVDGGFTAFSGV
ncbi:MAG: SDR family oxidoreductase [Saccharofermentanales bacterium]